MKAVAQVKAFGYMKEVEYDLAQVKIVHDGKEIPLKDIVQAVIDLLEKGKKGPKK